MSLSRNQLISYLKEIDITDKAVLDVGCGPKEKWARNFVKGQPKEYITADINPIFNPDLVIDLDYLVYFTDKGSQKNDVGIFEMEKYDIVFCLEALEHCWNPVQAIQNLEDFVKEGGVCYISAPFINPLHDEVDYLRYTPEWFAKVLPKVGFKEVIIKERVATAGRENLLWLYKEEGMRMSKIRLKSGEGGLLPLIGTFVEARK